MKGRIWGPDGSSLNIRGAPRRGQGAHRHYIPPRYPNVFNSGAPHEYYTEEDAREAVELARKVLAFARGALRTR